MRKQVTDDGVQASSLRQASPSPRPDVAATASSIAPLSRQPFQLPDQSAEENPWANVGESSAGRSRKKNATIGGKEAAAADKATEALKKQKNSKTQAAKDRIADDARVDIDATGVTAGSASKANAAKTGLPLEKAEDEDEASDEELGPSRIPKAFKQRDLVAQAFAGDNVISVSTNSSISWQSN